VRYSDLTNCTTFCWFAPQSALNAFRAAAA
jgi:hypothetical protein